MNLNVYSCFKIKYVIILYINYLKEYYKFELNKQYNRNYKNNICTKIDITQDKLGNNLHLFEYTKQFNNDRYILLN